MSGKKYPAPMMMYSPDTPTQPIRRDVPQATQPTGGIRDRLLRALACQSPVRSPITDTRPAHPSRKAQQREPFAYDDIRARLYREICIAQEQKRFYEAIRLQYLTWLLEDGVVTPLGAVREAWFKPAYYQRHQS